MNIRLLRKLLKGHLKFKDKPLVFSLIVYSIKGSYWTKILKLNLLKILFIGYNRKLLTLKQYFRIKKLIRLKNQLKFKGRYRKRKRKYKLELKSIKYRLTSRLYSICLTNSKLISIAIWTYLRENSAFLFHLKYIFYSYCYLNFYTTNIWSLHLSNQSLILSVITNFNSLYHLETNFYGFEFQLKGPLAQKKLGRTKTLNLNYLKINPNTIMGNWRQIKTSLISKLGIIGINLVVL